MIRHQAEAEHRQAVEPAVGVKELEVDEAIGVGFEDASAGVAALGDVVGQTGRDDKNRRKDDRHPMAYHVKRAEFADYHAEVSAWEISRYLTL